MSYLVPFTLALKPKEEALFHALVFTDEPDIPADTYKLREKYCPNPDCHCREALLEVFSVTSKKWIADIRVSLDPADMSTPRLDLSEDTAPYAQALLRYFTQNLYTDPTLLSSLRAHYNQVKAVAADPSHPAHSRVIQWGKTGGPTPSPNKPKRSKRTRQRH